MKKLVILSGAGLSAESGMQTYRDDLGLWNNHDINEICNVKTWKSNFDKVHSFYNNLRKQLKTLNPNLMHEIIAKWKKELKNNCVVITQNIDDLLERAGCDDVIHLHGTLLEMKCFECEHKFQIGYDAYQFSNCENCGSKWIKPDIVFFYENAPKYYDLYNVFANLTNQDLIVIIGTSGKVIHVNGLVTKKTTNILNNLCKQESINEQLFDFIFYEKATIAADKIDKIINQHFK